MIRKALGNNSFFVGESFNVGSNFTIGSNTEIRVRHFECGNNVSIGSNNKILVGNKMSIGDCGSLGNHNDITAINCIMGDYIYFDSNITIGHGGKLNYDSEISIGHRCMICSFVKLNVNYRIDIGDDVGIGEYVDIWTHGSFLPVLEGFPSQFGRVKIGQKVWLPAKSTVMPNVEIGNNVVIGVNSVINKNLPANSLCAGIPAKVIREDFYPKNLIHENKIALIEEVVEEYKKIQDFKNLNFPISLDKEKLTIMIGASSFDFIAMEATKDLTDEQEDFRDFLRRRGFKFFTGKRFKSITPQIYQDLLNYEG